MTQVDDLARTPVAALARSKRSADWCARLIAELPKVYVDAGLGANDYSQPQYTRTVANQRLWQRPYGVGRLETNPMLIPAGCAPSRGSDGQMDIHMPGGVLSVVGYVPPGGDSWVRFTSYVANYFRPGPYDAYAWAAAFTPDVLAGNSKNLGPSWPLYSTVPRPDDIRNGFTHMLPMSVPPTISMTGPPAPRLITDVDDPAIGTTYGASCSPALYLESTTLRADLTKAVPDGYRFALNPDKWTNTMIQAWAGTGSSLAVLRTQFAIGLRDYGFAVGVQTTGPGGTCAIPLDGSPEGRAYWWSMGLTAANSATLLAGLFTTVDDIIALAPPVSTAADGSTFTREGPAVSVAYATEPAEPVPGSAG